MSRLLDVSGMTFGNLVVIGRVNIDKPNSIWLCKCKLCGSMKEFVRGMLTYREGTNLGCGCTRKSRKPNPRWVTGGGALSSVPEFYVYAILDPRRAGVFKYGNWKFEFEPFYIGKGKGVRYASHLKKPGSTGLPKARKINKILEAGYQPIPMIKRYGLTEKEAFDLEIKLISVIGRLNKKTGPLTNLTDGGEGNSGAVYTDERKLSLSIAMANRTEEQRLLALAKGADTWAKKTKEELDGIRQKKLDTRAGWSESRKSSFENKMRNCLTVEDKKAARIKASRTMRSKTPEQKAEYSAKLRAAIARRTPEEQERINESKRRTRDAWSTERTAAYIMRQSSSSVKANAALTSEQRKLKSSRLSKSVTEQHRRLGHSIRKQT